MNSRTFTSNFYLITNMNGTQLHSFFDKANVIVVDHSFTLQTCQHSVTESSSGRRCILTDWTRLYKSLQQFRCLWATDDSVQQAKVPFHRDSVIYLSTWGRTSFLFIHCLKWVSSFFGGVQTKSDRLMGPHVVQAPFQRHQDDPM